MPGIDPTQLAEALRIFMSQQNAQQGLSAQDAEYFNSLSNPNLQTGTGIQGMASTPYNPNVPASYTGTIGEGQPINFKNTGQENQTDFGTDFEAYAKALGLKLDGTEEDNPNIDKKGNLLGTYDSSYQGNGLQDILQQGLPYMGMQRDLATNAFDIGRYAGMEKGTPGRGLGIAASAGDMLFGVARGVTAGIGFSKRNNYIEDWYRQQQNRRQYTPISQTQNNNITGGFSYGEDGGVMGQGMQYSPDDLREGQEVTFEYGGKMYSGKIKVDKNGQIYI